MSDENMFEVRFTERALKDFREAWPDLPPGDELLMKVQIDKCGICGGNAKDGSGFGAIEPEFIDGNGQVFGMIICPSCVEAGK